MKKKIKPQPFVKWAGGKRNIIKEIGKRFPSNFNYYFEPFLGGGAVFFLLEENISNALLSDINPELVIAYQVIKSSPYKLIKKLKRYAKKHSKAYYYQVRKSSPKDILDLAAKFLYLNKTCYNGLYRVNNDGYFNVPIGDYNNPDIVQEENIIACHKSLKKTKISLYDFSHIKPSKGDFVYFDPPYFPIKKDSFIKYTKESFATNDQIRLAKFIKQLDKRGVYIMLSNSMTHFIKDLYPKSHFFHHEVYSPRYVNCKGNKRGNVKELIITNY